MNIYHVRQELRKKSIFDLPLRFVYYARVSTDKEEQKNSIENQKQYFEDFIMANKNWKFCGGYIDDGVSGMHAEKREEFQRMLSDAKADKFDFIITKEISRFARNTLDSIQYTRKFLSYGVCIWFQNDGINTIDDDSEFRLTIMAGVAQDEIRKLSSRIRFGHAQAIKNGVVLGNSLFYGYDKKDGKLTVNEKEAEMIQLIFEKYATGAWSTSKIEKLLYEKGYRNHNGGKIDRGVIGNIIKNPKYKGYYAGGKVKIIDMFTKKQEFVPESEWNVFRDDGSRVPAIVDEKTWERANQIVKKRGDEIKNRRHSFKTNNLFTGIIYCANDGSPYWMKYHSVRGKEDASWVCSHRIKNGAQSCSSFPLAESELKEIISRLINSYDLDMDKYISQYMDIVKKTISNKQRTENPKEMKIQIEKLQFKMQKLLDYSLEGIISDEEFKKKHEECKKEINILSQKLSDSEIKEPEIGEIKKRIRKIADELEKNKGITADGIDKAVIQSLIKKIVVYPKGQKKALLKIFLKNGNEEKGLYNAISCSGNIFNNMYSEQLTGKPACILDFLPNFSILNMFPERRTTFYRELRSVDGHKIPVEYIYQFAI